MSAHKEDYHNLSIHRHPKELQEYVQNLAEAQTPPVPIHIHPNVTLRANNEGYAQQQSEIKENQQESER